MNEELLLNSAKTIGDLQPIFFTGWSSQSFSIKQENCCDVRFIKASSSTSAIEQYARGTALNHMQRAYVKLVAFRVKDNKAGLGSGIYLLIDSPDCVVRLVRQRELVENVKEVLSVVEINNKNELTMINMNAKDIKPVMTVKKYVI